MHTICPTSTTKCTWRQIQDREILEEGSFATHQDQGSCHRKEYTSGWRGYRHWAMWKRGVIVLVEPAWTSLEIKKCLSVQHYKAHWNITVYNPTLLLKSGISYFSISLIVIKLVSVRMLPPLNYYRLVFWPIPREIWECYEIRFHTTRIRWHTSLWFGSCRSESCSPLSWLSYLM